MSAFGLLGAHTVSIPKLYSRKGESSPMPFLEALQAPHGDFRFASQFEAAAIDVINNSRDEILELVQEVHFRTLGDWVESPEDQSRQQRFRECITEASYSRYASTLIGSSFLRRYESLLPTER
jgi:putative glycosyltransferase (TIGR04372 family)